MSNQNPDPLDFLKQMWGNMGFPLPGIVTPTLDVDELDKQIANLKAVEGWLKMNLQTLQMSIQGLEMQRLTLRTMQAISESASGENAGNLFSNAAAAFNPAFWPWGLGQKTEAAGASGGAETPPDEPKKKK
ncbi:MAG: hypothetical protein JNM82_15710 [Rhodocyclaceae bacterium]|nr:hypothetical protein [Rhodocyclaceae bacterium]